MKLKPSEAIKILEEIKEDNNGMYKYHQLYCTAINMGILAIETLEKQKGTFEWCSDCAEYDKERHCCHRFTKVIRQTVEECKKEYANEGWIPVTEKEPTETGLYLVTENTVVERKWVTRMRIAKCEVSKLHDGRVDVCWRGYGGKVLAWRPLPEPYTEEEA